VLFNMSKSIPIVRKLQTDAINETVSVVMLLRTAKVVAVKLGLDDALVWIDRELNGYTGVESKDLPKYRQLSGDPRCLNPHAGWQPLQTNDPEMARMLSDAPLGSGLASLERSLNDDSGGDLIFSYAPENKSMLARNVKGFTDFHVRLDKGQAHNVLDSVRNLILDWSLELEKAGILGEEMEFSSGDKREAVVVTQNIFAQNIGFAGTADGQAKVKNEQHVVISNGMDLEKLGSLISQVRMGAKLLPVEIKDKVEEFIEELDKEVQKEEPDDTKLQSILGSVRRVCEGAAGNLTAQGVLGLIKDMLENVG